MNAQPSASLFIRMARSVWPMVIARSAKRAAAIQLDCFVAKRLVMTGTSLRVMALAMGALMLTVSARAVMPNPYTLPVGVQARLTGNGSGSVTVYDESGTAPAISGSVSGGPADTAMMWPQLRPGQNYTVTVTSPGLSSLLVSLTAPDGFTTYVEDLAPTIQNTDLLTLPGGISSQSFKISLRPSGPLGSRAAGSFSGIAVGKAISWSVGLGKTRSGETAGFIYYREDDLSNSPAARARVYFSAPPNMNQIFTVKDGPANQTLRQISAPQTVVDLIDETDGFTMKFYDPWQASGLAGSGLRTLSGSPWKTIRVQQMSATQLRVTATEGGVSRVSDLALAGDHATNTYTWTLTEGNGARVTTVASTALGGGAREELIEVKNGSGVLASSNKLHYETFGWGEALTQAIANPTPFPVGTSSFTTNYTYHTNSAENGNYTRVYTMSDTSGKWASFAYYNDWDRRGSLYQEGRPWLDSPATAAQAVPPVPGELNGSGSGYFITRDYMADWSGRYNIEIDHDERIDGKQVGFATAYTTPNYQITGFSSPGLNGQPLTDFSRDTYETDLNPLRTYQVVVQGNGNSDFVGKGVFVRSPDQSAVSTQMNYGALNKTTRVWDEMGNSGTKWCMRFTTFNGSANPAAGDRIDSYLNLGVHPIYLAANKSTMSTSYLDEAGNVLRTIGFIYTGGGSFAQVSQVDNYYDTHGRLTQTVTSSGETTTYNWVDGQLMSTTDATGHQTSYVYDSLDRATTVTSAGAPGYGSYPSQTAIVTNSTFDAMGRVISQSVSGGTSTLTSSAAYDAAGRQIQWVAPGGFTTLYEYDPNGRIVKTTLPGGATRLVETHLDGQVKQVTGTAQVEQFFYRQLTTTYPYYIQTFTRSTSPASQRWQMTQTDWVGQTTKISSPRGWAGFETVASFNSYGQLTKRTQIGYEPTGPGTYNPTPYGVTLYEYNALGQLTREGLDVDRNGSLDLAGGDRIIDHVSGFVNDAGAWWWEESAKTYATAGSATPTTTGRTRSQVSGLSLSQNSVQETFDIYGNKARAVTSIDPANKLVTSVTTLPTSTTTLQQIAYNGLMSEARDAAGVTMRYLYDDLGRQVKTVDPRTGTSETSYVAGTSLTSWVKDSAGNTQAVYGYDAAGRVSSVRDVYGRYAYTEYNTRGQVIHQWGETAQPVEYTYDSLGQMAELHTYRGGSGWTSASWPASPGTADVTKWTFDEASGLLLQKTDAQNKSVSFTYNSAGQLLTRQWARGVVRTNTYNNATGELTTVGYSDSTPGASYTYNRSGQMAAAADIFDGGANQTRIFEYDNALQLKTEKLPAFLGNRWITYTTQDGTGGTLNGRPTGYTVGVAGTPAQDLSNTFGYDAYGRIGSVAVAQAGVTSRTFNYGYVANSSLLGTVTETTGTNYLQTRTYETNRNLLLSITTKLGVSSPVKTGFSYTYNELGQRATALQSCAATTAFADYGSDTYYRYNYDARGQLTGATGYMGSTVTATTTPMSGRYYGYAYDNAGNRTSANSSGLPALANTYVPNALNQYDSRENHYLPVSGIVASTAKVLVNGSIAGQQGKYWSGEAMPDNTNGPLYAGIGLKAGKPGSPEYKKTTTISAFIAKAMEVFQYDLDGNLTKDGRWKYTWDAENQLVSMETNAEAVVTGVPIRKLDFRYDSEGRRTMKRVYTKTDANAAWVPETTTSSQGEKRFVYQGWNLVTELDGSGNRLRSYTWGLDIAGSLGATGGIGALVQMVDHTGGSPVAYLPAYDGQGNVTAMMKASDGTFVAMYEYSPFGELLRKEGSYAAANPFRQSTKYTDEDSGLVYYGHRYYSSSTGRFINRDPSEESGGVNLYGFCGNNGINSYDYLGLDPQSEADYAMESSALWLQMRPENVGTSGAPLATEANLWAAMLDFADRAHAEQMAPYFAQRAAEEAAKKNQQQAADARKAFDQKVKDGDIQILGKNSDGDYVVAAYTDEATALVQYAGETYTAATGRAGFLGSINTSGMTAAQFTALTNVAVAAPNNATKTMVVAIDGAGGANAGDNPRFRQWAKEQGATTIYDGKALSGGGTLKQAYGDVKTFHTANPNGRIILLGYSAGGHEAVALANMLGKDKIGIDTMITFDPHRKNFFGYKDYELTGGNVANALNFYQRNELQLLSGTNPFRGSPIEGATNYNLTGFPTDHVNIVTDSLKHYGDVINAALNR